ncbi:DBH-like monooxygenase protein 2 homolog [Cebidichthys violaceus]|uniref:DBH-like monooxygenase protein 2 homolog n=1 Tax=Cebidichthys violaceus TaxID=271503 RepID=UPI0035CA083A
MRSLLPLLCLFSVWTKGAGASDPDLPFMEYLDQDHLVCLKWGFDNPGGTITFKLVVNTTGWVGLGFSSDGKMNGSDIVKGGVGPGGSYFGDYHGVGEVMPVLDEQQSYTLLSATESEGQTILTFQRSVHTCDVQDFQFTNAQIKIIYAFGTTDEPAYHGRRRGAKEVNLLNYVAKSPSTSLNYLSVTMDNVTVPENHTYYHCKVMKIQNLDPNTPYYIYQIEPVIEHPDIVHHMMLYSCPSFVKETYDKPCYMGDMGDTCFRVMAAWAVGGGVFELPENVGIPVGGADSNTLYRLEIHYNNPNKEAGRRDSSGLRLHYTVQRREYDGGVLTTGVIPNNYLNYSIPPKATQFHTYGVCNTSLFSQLVNPVPELHVFAGMLHTHLAGRKVRVGHYRNGKQIDFLLLNENYNFELQQSVTFGTFKTIKQGDEIAVECTYSTTDRTNVTRMGLATTDEMCLAFLYYYPAIKISICVSHPNTSMSDDAPTSDSDPVAAQESFLKDLPQIQYTSDDQNTFSINRKGTVREMMETPTVTCRTNNAASGLATSRIMNLAGITLLLLWVAVM